MAEQQWTPELTVAPTLEPVSIADAKKWAWVTSSADDTDLTRVVTTIRERLERLCGLALVTQTWKMYLDRFPCYGTVISPHKRPVVSVSSIVYTADDGTSTTWSTSEYEVDVISRPARIYPGDGYSWPSTRRKLNAVAITYVAGHAATAAAAVEAVPQEIKKRIEIGAHYLYDNRREPDWKFLDDLLGAPADGWNGSTV